MINDDLLIKIIRSRGFRNWPDKVNIMKLRLEYIKLGFPGIRNNHLSLIYPKDLKIGDIFIYDVNIEGYKKDPLDTAPKMLKLLNSKECFIEGIGLGLDLNDTERMVRWKDIIPIPNFNDTTLLYRVDVRPTLNGGPGYYYFYKSYRDFRT